MRYVVETFTSKVSPSKSVTVVERVFVNAGSRQYSTVECDLIAAGWDLYKFMPKATKATHNILKL
jgi:hypothetical protein